MVRQAAAGADGNRQQSKPLDESDAAAPTPTGTVRDDEDAPSGADAGSAGKKRKLAASGRGVANLTPEQLAKKRANDREAQRAIRERTKNQIQTLERRIEELTGLQPYQELQAAIDAKVAAERENAEIRQQLATIIGMLRPLIGQLPENTFAGAAAGAGAAAQQQPKSNSTAELDRRTHSPPAGGQPTPTSTSGGVSGSDIANGQHHAAQRLSDLDQQREQLRHGLDMGPERLGLGFLLDARHQVSRIHGAAAPATGDSPLTYRYPAFYTQQHASGADNVSPGASTTASTTSRAPPQWQPGSASSYNNAFPSGYPYRRPHVPAATTGDYDDDDHYNDEDAGSNADEAIEVAGSGAGAGGTTTTIPRYAAPVRTTPPTCPLDALLLDFLQERRQRTAEGQPAHEVLGPRYPSVSSLLNPAHSARAHPLSRVFTDILAKFPDISGLPERVAVLYVMFLIMRWQVAPTRANYERLPVWARPLRAQLRDPPHPAWIDHLPFPRMRAVLVREHASGAYPFDHFFIPYTTTLTLSWPYRDTDTLLQSPHAEELMINPVFERHLRNLDNWKLGGAFARAFPGLADTGNVPEAELAAARAAATTTTTTTTTRADESQSQSPAV
ncbi:hypothetical protein V2A60_008852 [Cordyceps javanica]